MSHVAGFQEKNHSFSRRQFGPNLHFLLSAYQRWLVQLKEAVSGLPAEPIAELKTDLLTVAAIGITVYLLSALIHEAVGHGLTAYLVGARVLQITNAYVETDHTGLSAWAVRAISAGGCVANFIFGTIILVWYRKLRDSSAQLRYFLWLLGIINFFKGSGYMLALSFASFGDWNNFLEGIGNKLPWQLGLTALGAVIYMGTFFYAVRSIEEFLGSTSRRKRALALTLTPYLVGGIVNSLAAALGPGGTSAVFFSAALATFGGTWLLVWVPSAVGTPRFTTSVTPLTVSRGTGWILLGLVALGIYFFILGLGLIW